MLEIIKTVNSTTASSDVISNALGIFLGMGAIVGVIVIAIIALTFIGKWQVFKKMDLNGALVFVPFYSDWKLYEKVWKPVPIFFVMLGLELAWAACSGLEFGLAYNESSAALIMNYAIKAICVAMLIIRIKFLHNISTSLGHGGWMTFLGVILEPIYWMVLGLGKSKYLGNKYTNTFTTDMSYTEKVEFLTK